MRRIMIAAVLAIGALALAGDKQKMMGDYSLTATMAPRLPDGAIPAEWGKLVGYGVTLYGPAVGTEYMMFEADDGTLRRVITSDGGKLSLGQVIHRTK